MNWQDQLGDIAAKQTGKDAPEQMSPIAFIEDVLDHLNRAPAGSVYLTAHPYDGDMAALFVRIWADLHPGDPVCCERADCDQPPAVILMNHSEAEAIVLCKDCYHDFEILCPAL